MSLSLLVTSSQLNSMSSGSSLSIRLMCLQMMLGMMGDRSTMSFFFINSACHNMQKKLQVQKCCQQSKIA
jgi:hypothetical protein